MLHVFTLRLHTCDLDDITYYLLTNICLTNYTSFVLLHIYIYVCIYIYIYVCIYTYVSTDSLTGLLTFFQTHLLIPTNRREKALRAFPAPPKPAVCWSGVSK